MTNWTTHEITNSEMEQYLKFNTSINVADTPHAGVILRSEDGREHLGIYDPAIKSVRPLTKHRPVREWKPANKDLHLFYDHLQNEEVLIVIADGYFGTGKTGTIMAHAVEKLKGDVGFQLYLTKPHVPVGKTHGHLPGTLDEKTDPEYESFYQYIKRLSQLEVESLKQQERLHVTTLEYVRGRDITNGWVVVDEAQNLTREEIITIASRVGAGGKLILLGDTSKWQKDRKADGLEFLMELLAEESIVGVSEFKTPNHVLRGKVAKTLIKALNNMDKLTSNKS